MARAWARPAAYLAFALLATGLLWRAAHPLHAFQVDDINKALGRWSLRFLFAALLIAPVSQRARLAALRRWRRPLGLAAFAFALLHTGHFLVYGRVWPDRMLLLLQKPYWAVGLAALALFAPLALTSNDWAVRRLGPARWKALHRLAYPAALLSVVHAAMGYAPLLGEAGLYLALAALLLAHKARIVITGRPPGRSPPSAPAGRFPSRPR